MEKLSIIIVARNQWEQTEACLLSLADALPDLPVEIIVVDNGSTDGTPEYLRQLTDVHAILNDDNLGLAAAWNAGARQATGDVLLFSHNDVFFTRNSVRRMLETLQEEPEAGAVGVFTNRSRYCLANLPAYRSGEELQGAAEMFEARQKRRVEQMVLDGPCLLMTRRSFELVGGFDEAYRLPGLECVDFSFRMHMKGLHLYAAATYVHHNEDSFAVNHIDAAQVLQEQEPLFRARWGTSTTYSTFLRRDILTMMDMGRPGLRVLDVGCACGANLMRIHDVNPSAERFGIELNEKTAAIARCFGEISNEDVEKLDRPDWAGTFDYVIAGDILEHLRDPWTAVRHLAGLLKPGGHLLASVPNVICAETIFRMLQGRWDYVDAGILDRTHLRFFTKQTTREMMEGAGLAVHAMKPTHAAGTDRLQVVAQSLRTLPWVKATEEELVAYQWLVDACREAPASEDTGAEA